KLQISSSQGQAAGRLNLEGNAASAQSSPSGSGRIVASRATNWSQVFSVSRKLIVCATVSAFFLSQAASAAVYSYTFSSGFNNGGVIPDGDVNGWADTHSLSIVDGGITSVSVTLNISGGYNGDLYGYLVHSSGFTVLLDRVGSPANAGFGYSNPGFGPTAGNQAFTLS